MKLNQFRSKKIFGIFPLMSLVGLLLGAFAGYLYYNEVGCVSGTCAITSNPWMSTLWGAAMGYLFLDMFRPKEKAKEENPTT